MSGCQARVKSVTERCVLRSFASVVEKMLLSFKANNRRNLCSDSLTSVFDTWKKMFMDEYLIPTLVEKNRMCRAYF